MFKRFIDIALSSFGLFLFSPLLVPAIIAIWLQDFRSPFYIANRVGRGGHLFRMVKLRTMVVNADKAGIDSTSANDTRITAVGHIVRSWKLDELSQLWNVLSGDMSLVGPRPNVKSETDRYTDIERSLLNVKPGITDIASIVFSDEGTILSDSNDPDLDYNRLIRPWKSRLGLLYIEHQNVSLDIALMALTGLTIVSRSTALKAIEFLLERLDAPDDLQDIARRDRDLSPFPPPGAKRPVDASDLYGERATV